MSFVTLSQFVGSLEARVQLAPLDVAPRLYSDGCGLLVGRGFEYVQVGEMGIVGCHTLKR